MIEQNQYILYTEAVRPQQCWQWLMRRQQTAM